VHSFELAPSPSSPGILEQINSNNIIAHYGFNFDDLDRIMKLLGHEGRYLAVLKIDIESAEFGVVENMVKVLSALFFLRLSFLQFY
jgi:hypothetical protein